MAAMLVMLNWVKGRNEEKSSEERERERERENRKEEMQDMGWRIQYPRRCHQCSLPFPSINPCPVAMHMLIRYNQPSSRHGRPGRIAAMQKTRARVGGWSMGGFRLERTDAWSRQEKGAMG